jgi:hypothetical protein
MKATQELVPDRWSPTGWSWQDGPSRVTKRHLELYRFPGVDNRVDERHQNLTPDRWKPSGWRYVKESRTRSYKNIRNAQANHMPRDLVSGDYQTSYQAHFTPPPKHHQPAKSYANLMGSDSPFNSVGRMRRPHSQARQLRLISRDGTSIPHTPERLPRADISGIQREARRTKRRVV